MVVRAQTISTQPFRRLDIVHAITRFIRGGADENTLLTCNAQAQAGHRVRLIHGNDFHCGMIDRLHGRIEPIRLGSLQREINPIADAKAFLSMKSLLRRDRPDIVHTHESKAGIIGRIAARQVGVPLIVHGVHILPHLSVDRLRRLIYLSAERLAASATDAFVNVSAGMRDECLVAGLGLAEKHHVIESGMEISRFKEARALNRRQDASLSGLSVTDPVLVLMVGALEPRKRVGEFLNVFAKLVASSDRACLVLAGEGPERASIEHKVRALGLLGRVACLGHRDDVDRLIATADICVHSATREGLPRVVVQYVAAGKPVVVTDLPGIDALVTNGDNGFVTALTELEQMAEPLLHLIDDPNLRREMAQQSASRDLSAWSADSMCERIDQLYARLIAEKRARIASGESIRESARELLLRNGVQSSATRV